MKKSDSRFGYQDFAWFPPGSAYSGREYPNDWFIGRMRDEKIGSSEEIETRTGILSRRIAGCTESVVSMASASVREFYAKNRDYVRENCAQLLLLTTAVDDRVLGVHGSKKSTLVQSAAERVAHAVGVSGNMALGICFACSSAARGTEIAMSNADDMKDDEHVLLVGAEKLSAMTDLSSPVTGFLFGDGVSVGVMRHNSRLPVLHAFSAEEQSNNLISMRRIDDALMITGELRQQQCIQMNGREVFKKGTELMMRALGKSLYESNISPREVASIIPHQANHRFVEQIRREWLQRYPHVEAPEIDISILHSGNNGAGSWFRRMAEKQADGSLDQIDGVIAAPFAGGGEYMSDKKLSYGNILLDARS
ncbi:MAG: hypothetical protein ABL890_00175 [Candidatus Peribacteraceae bacterium]